MTIMIPDFSDVEAAARLIAPYCIETPLLESPSLSRRLGGRLLLKAENLQVTGSFKLRGAAHRVASLSDAERQRGVVARSSGNHASSQRGLTKWRSLSQWGTARTTLRADTRFATL
jgi:threonine dehydratase